MTLVLALPGAAPLAAQLASRLACEHALVDVHRFPDGEQRVRVDAPVAGRPVVLVADLAHPDDKVLPLLFAVDVLRELGATRVGLVAPYLPYLRQDSRFHPGEAVSSRTFARLLSDRFDFLVTVEPHLHRWHSLADIFRPPSCAVSAAKPMAQWIRRHVERPHLVGPDTESRQWVARIAAELDAPFTVLHKARSGDAEVRIEDAHALPPGFTPVVVDDIVSSGGTLLAAAGMARAGHCVCVHALHDAVAAQRLAAAGIALASCDTVAHPSNAITVVAELAAAVRALGFP